MQINSNVRNQQKKWGQSVHLAGEKHLQVMKVISHSTLFRTRYSCHGNAVDANFIQISSNRATQNSITRQVAQRKF